MAPQVGPDAIIMFPIENMCRRCGIPYEKNRKDKLYCGPACQSPNRFKNADVYPTKAANRALNSLDEQVSFLQLADAFERSTGMPFTIKLEHMPRRRLLGGEEPMLREEQGSLWWNGPAPAEGEADPVDVERRLMAGAPAVCQHVGETVAEWTARGGIIKVLPPGRAELIA